MKTLHFPVWFYNLVFGIFIAGSGWLFAFDQYLSAGWTWLFFLLVVIMPLAIFWHYKTEHQQGILDMFLDLPLFYLYTPLISFLFAWSLNSLMQARIWPPLTLPQVASLLLFAGLAAAFGLRELYEQLVLKEDISEQQGRS